MTNTPQASGADLARQALAAARAAAKTRPTEPARKTRRTVRESRTGGRDPLGLGGVLERLTADQGWADNLGGGNILDQWTTLCPQYADTVQPIAYDPDRGRLDLRPTTYAYASQLRLLGGQLAKQINDKMGRPVVRTIRVLPVGAINQTTHTAATAGGQETPAPQQPVRTRETASPGYRTTLEAHQDAKPDARTISPHISDAIDRQNRILADPRNREPETAFTDAVAELERLTAPTAVDRAEQIRLAAIARKRAGDTAEPRRAFDVA
ncbi:DciA family protein [Streptomyces kaempferi]|uniref:DciA family protein n=1 Tax=Streptomyces kaempferi TaxID=333725 RepID=A0ABW3XHK2_9ACTN